MVEVELVATRIKWAIIEDNVDVPMLVDRHPWKPLVLPAGYMPEKRGPGTTFLVRRLLSVRTEYQDHFRQCPTAHATQTFPRVTPVE